LNFDIEKGLGMAEYGGVASQVINYRTDKHLDLSEYPLDCNEVEVLRLWK
jgi:hypothetical protein